jgi:membrane associated rhomboid family serine protease
MMVNFSGQDQEESRSGGPSGAPIFLWILLGVMAAIEIGLSISEYEILGSTSQRGFALVLGAFWPSMLSGVSTPVYPGHGIFMFFTYAFLHGGFFHLAMNGVILLSLGKFLSTHLGSLKTLFVLFVSTIAGAAFFGFLSQNNDPMIGASGAVFGLIGAWQAMQYVKLRRLDLPVGSVLMAILGLIAANVLIYLLLSGRIAWEAHLGGWIAGWLLGRHFAKDDRISLLDENTDK